MSESDGEAESDALSPSDAFGLLGNEIRVSILRALLCSSDGETVDPNESMTFSELYERSDAENSAQFAYHLRQLTGHYLQKTGETYRFTYAGLKVARAVMAGTYTDRFDFGPAEIEGGCPICREQSLSARGQDNYVTVACDACESSILKLPFPPGGYGERSTEQLLWAFDRHHRHRLSLMSDGVCPECTAEMDASVDYTNESGVAEERRAQLQWDCEQCGCQLRAPVTLGVLEHPAVVSFYHRHGVDIQERPIWNVGEEWSEQILSDDPRCVQVTTRIEDDTLCLLVGDGITVVEVDADAA